MPINWQLIMGECICLLLERKAVTNLSEWSLSHVWLFVTPWTVAYQAPQYMVFPRQEYWSGLPFPSPMHKSESEAVQSCLTLSNPMDCSLPGSSVHGISQARVLEWGATAFSINRHEWLTIPWRREWQPTLVFLPGEFHGQRGVWSATVHGITKSRTRLSD